MTHAFIGDLGHTFVIISFITCLIACFSFWKAAGFQSLDAFTVSSEYTSWIRFSRAFFYLHALAVFGIIFCLFYIIYHHYYEYHYAWDHSSNSLPAHYMISCFWEGQEGSFLLWIFWHVLLGLVLIHQNKSWEAPLMAVFCLVQAFLASMILGIIFPDLDFRIGSSPFLLLKEFMGDIPVYKLNPEYVPEDGTGLNPLLQNYWMVIHPPTLFLGFATTVIPFAYCIAGLWKKRYKEWIRPALPWALFSAMVLGTGILMGGYWAYETLNFGGYWNWDPVENAVYVPWLVLVACIHTMITFKNSESALKASIILSTAVFLLILYSTFLTRSGILGSSSVHSFTDLGLSGQLLVYLLVFVLLTVYMIVRAWKKIPASGNELSAYSREFWIFVGASVLCLAAFQVLATTSIPVYNSVLALFDVQSNLAPPADQETHYSRMQVWAAILIAILSGMGQFFWWKKVEGKNVLNALSLPLIISLLAASLIVLIGGQFNKVSYILLLTASLFSIAANLQILAGVVKNNYKLSGGAIAHIGIAMMLIGILYSSGYSRIISVNTTGLLYSKEFTAEMNRDNILLWRNEVQKMGPFELLYKGARLEVKNYPGYVNKEDLLPLDNKYQAVAKKEIIYDDKVYFHRGDTVGIYPENTYYEVLYKKENGDTFTLYPRAQVNPQMGLIASPDIKRFFGRDLYSHVSSIPAPDQEREWSKPESHEVRMGDTIFLNDYVAVLQNVQREVNVPGVKLKTNDAAVKADIRILGKDKTYNVYPLYVVMMDDKMVGQIPETVEDLGIKISFVHIDPAAGKFTFEVTTTQKDYIIIKALEKPLINVLWIGTLLLVCGLGMAILRRYSEFRKMREKGME